MSTSKLIDDYLDPREAAEQLGMTRDQVYRLVRLRMIRHHRLGTGKGVLRFLKADLKAFLESCAVNPAPARGGDKGTKLKHLRQ